VKLSGHAPALDGVRGTAALLVLVGHIGNRELFMIPGVAHDLLGKPGVWLFFALSAFLLTARLTEELESAPDSRGVLAAYALNRMFRIFPLYSIVIATHWLLGEFTGPVAVKHLFLLAGWRHLWAIPAEFSFYFVIPFIAAFAVRFGRARAVQVLWVALLLAFAFNVARPDLVFRDSGFIHGKLAPFLAGSLGALLALERRAPAPSRWRRVVLPALAVAGFAAASQAYRDLALANLPFQPGVPLDSLALGVFGTALISLALEPNWLGRFMGSAPLAFFGRVSFSLYLWHEPIIMHARALGLEFGPPIVQAWVYFGVSTLAAWISYRVIERPGMAVGRRLGRSLRARRLAVA
jgi:peptidoglycan/LPS O-acetylase OafA/YrhL